MHNFCETPNSSLCFMGCNQPLFVFCSLTKTERLTQRVFYIWRILIFALLCFLPNCVLFSTLIPIVATARTFNKTPTVLPGSPRTHILCWTHCPTCIDTQEQLIVCMWVLLLLRVLLSLSSSTFLSPRWAFDSFSLTSLATPSVVDFPCQHQQHCSLCNNPPNQMLVGNFDHSISEWDKVFVYLSAYFCSIVCHFITIVCDSCASPIKTLLGGGSVSGICSSITRQVFMFSLFSHPLGEIKNLVALAFYTVNRLFCKDIQSFSPRFRHLCWNLVGKTLHFL